MTLEELASLPALPRSEGAAPEWLLGCFRRRSITFYNGLCDTSTEVYWLQTRSLCVDLRVSPARPRARGRMRLDDFSDPELELLAQAEGGAARTDWDGTAMRWSDWHAFQLHDKWPERGYLRRVGDCVIEFPPSGAYVEDWRAQQSRPGLLLGLNLMEEREPASGRVTHRGGALLVCGDHAALVRGRPGLAPADRWADVLRDCGPRQPAQELFACETSYARRDPASGDFTIALSTNPLREGQVLRIREGFEVDGRTRQVRQIVAEEGGLRERTFTVDTIERDHVFRTCTDAGAGAAAWLAGEAETLLAHAKGGDDC